ncbi:MAG: rod shape-determining protein RodA [Gammaproteobacteria bacterium]|nr:MAG: rod shape-determining protein RodA [Gammaproteobacteria bacterium]
MKILTLAFALACTSISSTAFSHEKSSTSPTNAKVYFITPVDGQTISQNFTIKFGLSGMGVAPAGTNKKNTGHHHILIDTDVMPDMHAPLPATDKIKHFGGGQTETQLTLSPGKHTLQLVLGNYQHIPHNKPVVSHKIMITVK